MIGWESWEEWDESFPPPSFFALFPSFFTAAFECPPALPRYRRRVQVEAVLNAPSSWLQSFLPVAHALARGFQFATAIIAEVPGIANLWMPSLISFQFSDFPLLLYLVRKFLRSRISVYPPALS